MTVKASKEINATPKSLKNANALLLSGNFADAIRCYVEVIQHNPDFLRAIHLNLHMAQNKLWNNLQLTSKVDVLFSCLGSVFNTERQSNLISSYNTPQSPAYCINFISTPENKEKLVLLDKTKSNSCQVFNTRAGAWVFKEVIDFVLKNPFKLVQLTSLEFPDVLTGLAYKWIWGATVFVDISDETLLTRISNKQPDIKLLLNDISNGSNYADAYGAELTNIAVSALSSFDFISCASEVLQSKFGGIHLSDFNSNTHKASFGGKPNYYNKLSCNNEFNLVTLLKFASLDLGGTPDNIAFSKSSKLGISRHSSTDIKKKIEGKFGKDIVLIKKSGLFDFGWYNSQYLNSQVSEEQAIQHYLEVGFKSGLDPSFGFCTSYYLSRYKSVADSGMNPLIHYIKYGQSKGYQSKEISVIRPENDFGTVDVYLTCWLRNRESIHDGLLNLFSLLRSQGFKVRFITHSEPMLKAKNIDALNVTFSILGTTAYLKQEEADLPSLIELDILSVIKKTHQSIVVDYDDILSIIRKAYTYWKREFELNKPKLVVIWGSTCPMSRLQIFLCKELNISYLIMERGHFSGTLSVDVLGQFAFGGGEYLPRLKQLDLAKYNKIKEWVGNCEEVPYSHKNSNLNFSNNIIKANKEKRPVVLFIGVNDVGSGVAYGQDALESHAVYFKSSFSALNILKETLAVVCPEALLVIKPHPADKSDYQSLCSENVILEPETNINELIKIANVCVTMSTTAIARCIIEEKPVVVLSLTDVSGFNIAYECNDPSEIAAVMRSALAEQDITAKRLNGKLFIQRLFADRLFSVERNELCNSVDDLAQLIATRISLKSYLKNAEKIHSKEGCQLPECVYNKYEFGGPCSVPENLWLGTDIVIPVYSDAELSELAITTALNSLDDNYDCRLIIINDASPDPLVYKLFDKLRKQENPRLIVLENTINLGFSGTVNRALEYSKDRDILLLNSDAIVPDNFISRIKAAAYSHYRVATVTPLSNNASVFSAPTMNGYALEKEQAIDTVSINDSLLAIKNPGFSIEVPVGHGFCMYLRRSALNRLGYFNELLFGRGYSEEVDFCLRARSAGFLNVCVPSVYVGHVGGVSFGADANAMKIKNRKIIQERYPTYFDEMRAFTKHDPLSAYRSLEGSQNVN